MINFSNPNINYQKIQALQQVPSNQVIIGSPDEVSYLVDIAKELKRQALMNQIEARAEGSNEISIGKKINIYV